MSMNECPIEILENIFKYCDNKSILNLGRVNNVFYHITKNKKTKIKDQLLSFVDDKDDGVFKYISTNNCYNFEMLLSLGLVGGNSSMVVTRSMIAFTSYLGLPCETSIIDLCIKFKRLYMVKLLLKFGLDVNKRNDKGLTPLMTAISQPDSGINNYSYDIIVALLKAGSDPNIENNYGYIAMDMIHSDNGYFGTEFTKDLLREYGSREGSVYQYSMYDYHSDSDVWNF
jgi:hypothetical protein